MRPELIVIWAFFGPTLFRIYRDMNRAKTPDEHAGIFLVFASACLILFMILYHI